jgi:hypothetical protein
MGDVGRAAQAGASVADAAISASAAKYGADKQAEAAANSLAFNKQVYGDTLGNEQPYRTVGADAANSLNAGLQDGSLTAAYPGGDFHFDGVNLQNDPAYNFDLQQGQQAVQRSAAAQGGLVSGGALKDLNDYTQGYASNQFQQSYSNALAAYQQSYNQFEGQQANKFNRLSSAAGLGQNAVTMTAASGQNAAANAANIAQTGAAGQAAGMMGVSNALQGGINGAVNAFAVNSGSSYGRATQGIYDTASGTQLPGAPAYHG